MISNQYDILRRKDLCVTKMTFAMTRLSINTFQRFDNTSKIYGIIWERRKRIGNLLPLSGIGFATRLHAFIIWFI